MASCTFLLRAVLRDCLGTCVTFSGRCGDFFFLFFSVLSHKPLPRQFSPPLSLYTLLRQNSVLPSIFIRRGLGLHSWLSALSE